ncbi:MAG: hypothetical protein KDH16_22785 [Rhodocyclaceae bacterium]|nr:hypothetical protein [Rhodocyclaceae bacterium]
MVKSIVFRARPADHDLLALNVPMLDPRRPMQFITALMPSYGPTQTALCVLVGNQLATTMEGSTVEWSWAGLSWQLGVSASGLSSTLTRCVDFARWRVLDLEQPERIHLSVPSLYAPLNGFRQERLEDRRRRLDEMVAEGLR